ncbi:MAG: alpha/beta hydrolase [Parvibaculum sp.]|nr:alpha/beta hydrolase [Parvibaculum sp.]
MSVDMKTIKANGITINYEDRGPADGRPLLLVNGYTSTMMSWPVALMDGLKARGFRVIRYDNRDVGKSEKLKGIPDISLVAKAVREGTKPDIPYTLSDMAADGMGLLDALGISQAHIMGISMGGMIVQSMAINHPEKIISATSIMSSTGGPDVPRATDAAMVALQERPTSGEREVVLRHNMKGRRVYQSPAYPMSDEALYQKCATEYDHMFYPEGASRQYAAIIGDGSRCERLKSVKLPFLVIHGNDDPLVPPGGGIDTAKYVAGSKLVLIDGMGHDLPVELCPRYVELIAELAESAERKAAAE